MEACFAKCLNGGACVNGKCVCTKNWGGEFCDDDLLASNNVLWWILLGIVLLVVAAGAFLLFKTKKDSWLQGKDKTDPLNNNFKENDQDHISVN